MFCDATDDVDTRAITRRLREDGSLIGVLSTDNSKTDEELLQMSKSWDIVGKDMHIGGDYTNIFKSGTLLLKSGTIVQQIFTNSFYSAICYLVQTMKCCQIALKHYSVAKFEQTAAIFFNLRLITLVGLYGFCFAFAGIDLISGVSCKSPHEWIDRTREEWEFSSSEGPRDTFHVSLFYKYSRLLVLTPFC